MRARIARLESGPAIKDPVIDTASIRHSLLGFGVAFLAGWAIVVQAQNDAPEDKPQKCLSLARLDSTVAVDDRTILFFMRGSKNEVFRNDLPEVCRDLGRNRTFSYRVASSRNPRLCRNDLISVQESRWTCPLGEFRLISRQEADELQKARGDGDSASDPATASGAAKPDAVKEN